MDRTNMWDGKELRSVLWAGKCRTFRVLLAALLGMEWEEYEAKYPSLIGIKKC